MDSGFDSATREGSGDTTITMDCSQSMKIYSLAIQKQDEYEQLWILDYLCSSGRRNVGHRSTNAMYGIGDTGR